MVGYCLYFSEYTSIENIEQRRRYKADFNADYAEYRDLHAIVEKVSRRFADLEEKLKQEAATSLRYKVRMQQFLCRIHVCIIHFKMGRSE